MRFADKLNAAWTRSGTLLCVGLDPDPTRAGSDVAGFLVSVVQTTADLVCAFKPNVAFYEALGPARGYEVLARVLDAIPPHVVTICDAKRGDVPHTASAYARAMFDELGFDAVTVNAYLGGDATRPFVERPGRGAFVVCRTSNAGARDVQDVDTGGRPLYERIAEHAREWNEHGNVGLVVGATYPDEMQRLRELCPDMTFLVPGVGAQGGDLEACVRSGAGVDGRGLIISASRSVVYAPDPRAEVTRLRDRIARALDRAHA